KRGWILLRIDAEMTLHDMAMTRFGQWWRRCVRSGFGFAEGAVLHGGPPQRHWVREVRSIGFWGLVLPALILALALPTRGASLARLAGYPSLSVRPHRYGIRRGWSEPEARLFARWCVLSEFPLALGLIVYWFRRLTGRQRRIIEYKGAGPAAAPRDLGAGAE